MKTANSYSSEKSYTRPLDDTPDATVIHPWRFFLVLGILAMAALLFVHLRSAAERLQKEKIYLSEKNNAMQKVTDNLYVQIEEYTSYERILAGITAFRLDLRPPQSGQVSRVSLGDRENISTVRQARPAVTFETAFNQ